MSTDKKRVVRPEEFDSFLSNLRNTLQKFGDDEYDNVNEIIEELSMIIDGGKDIITILKNKPTAFSSIAYKDLRLKYGFSLPEDYEDLEDYKPIIVIPPFEWLNEIRDHLKRVSLTVGVLTSVSNETQKKFFIDAFINTLLDKFEGTIINAAEETVTSNPKFSGKIEYIFKAFRECIIVIVEAKYSVTEAKDFGQIMVELFSIYQYNISIGKKMDCVYGILTDAVNWTWWKYDGKRFFYSHSAIRLTTRDKLSIPKIASVLYGMLISGFKDAYKMTYEKDIDEEYKVITSAKNNNDAINGMNQLKKKLSGIYKGQDWSIDPEYEKILQF
jgi:hypothetical protein